MLKILLFYVLGFVVSIILMYVTIMVFAGIIYGRYGLEGLDSVKESRGQP